MEIGKPATGVYLKYILYEEFTFDKYLMSMLVIAPAFSWYTLNVISAD